MKKFNDKKVLLYSGGMDSWLIDKLWKPDVKLYVDMNTTYSKEEIQRLPKDVIVEKLNLSKWERPDLIIPLRNLYLVMMASNYGNNICLGATLGDRVLDKTIEFADKSSDLLTYLYQSQHWTEERHFKVNIDYKKFSKTHLLQLYLQQGGDIEKAFTQSFSCYDPNSGKECWSCKPCFRKFISFYLCGYCFNPNIETKVFKYLEAEVIPKIKGGCYGRGPEELEIMEVYNKLCEKLL